MFFWAPFAILAMTLFVIVGGEGVRLLWNWLMPSIFGLREITFAEGLGLLVLSRILFGSFRSHGMSRSAMRRRVAERAADQAADRMTPEEFARFRRRIIDRWGVDPWPPPEAPRKDSEA
jgi:hypothetical protein